MRWSFDVKRTSDEERIMKTIKEAKLTVGGGVEFYNMVLIDVFMTRTFYAINEQRQRRDYRRYVDEYMVMLGVNDPVPLSSPPPLPQDNLTNAPVLTTHSQTRTETEQQTRLAIHSMRINSLR